MVNVIRCFALIVLGVAYSLCANAAIDVRVDRQTVSIDETVRVVFSSDSDTEQPDFSPLERDFELLGTAQSTNVSIINGQMQQTVSWTIDLQPRRVGDLTVASIDFGSARSQERTITVTAAMATSANGDAEVFLEVEAKPATPYVQAQMRFTVRVFRSVRISDASITEPTIETGDAVIERLGDDIVYETTRGDTRYAVVERRYAIFPQQSGSLVIEPLVFAARIGGRTSFFDRSSGRIVRTRSEAMEIDVLPIPDQFPGQVWLPAEHIALADEWPGDDDQWRVGEPLTRSLILRARGLTASQLPEISMPLPDGFKQYPDQPQLDTRTSDITQLASRRETIALIPSRPGEYTLPAIEFPWWNTETDSLEYARVPARTVHVLPALGAAPETVIAQPQPDSGLSLTPAGNDTTSILAPESTGPDGLWKAVSLAFALLWLSTLAGWWWSRRQVSAVTQPRQKQPPGPAIAVEALERACGSNNAAAAQEVLLQWATTRWPGNPARSLGELAARFDGPMQSALHQLSRARFGNGDDSWNGAALWQAFAPHKSQRDVKPADSKPQLEPLYRN